MRKKDDRQGLESALAALHPSVRLDEARKAAQCAYERSEALAEDYAVIRSPLFHNFLVNIGVKQRGLCYHWAEDLLGQLQMLGMSTLQLHWGIAREGTVREHNSVVVTARAQSFDEGIVLDPWRRSGRLTWIQVRKDRYPWKEGELEPPSTPRSEAGRPAATLQ